MNVLFLSGTVVALVFIETSSAAPIQLLSARNPALPLPAVADSDSVDPKLTPDGRFVLFASSATDLTTNTVGSFTINLYLRDNASNTITLVSVNPRGFGGNGHSLGGMVSTNGRYVVFQSDASDLVPRDTNITTDIFLRDEVAGTIALVSASVDGSPGNGSSTDPVMTPDGRFIVFISAATNLVPNDTNGIPDVFVRDTWSNTTALVSVGAQGLNSFMGSPQITPDGKRVVFFSTASGLAPGAPPLSSGEIYLRDLTANSTVWVSTNAANIASNLLHLNYAASYHPALSEDGNIVAFKTGWTNGTTAPPIPSSPESLLFRFDATTGSNTLVSTSAFPRWAYSDDIYGPEISPDGRLLLFVETNDAPANSLSLVAWDAQTGTNILISAMLDGSLPTNTISTTPILSHNARFVAFVSSATNLVTNAISNGSHIYLRDLLLNTTQLVDANSNGVGSADEFGTIPSLDASGKFIAFSATDQRFVYGPNVSDVFLRDISGSTTQLISQRHSGAVPRTGNALSSLDRCSFSADGRWVVFSSFASDLVTNVPNNDLDVFVADLQTGSNMLVSVGLDGNSAPGSSFNPVISANARFVAFVSAASNLATNQTDPVINLFIRDLKAGTTSLIGPSTGHGDASFPIISSNGQYVAFLCQTNPSAPFSGTFWSDVVSGSNILLSGASAFGPSLSADGQRVAYSDSSSNLYVWDAHLSQTVYTNPAKAAFAALAPLGNRLLWIAPGETGLTVFDLTAASNLFSIAEQPSTPATQQGASLWSRDGRFLTFATTTSLVSDDTNGLSDVYLCDLQTGMITLVSANYAGTGGANGASDIPAISGDGRFIAFRSFAPDVIPGVVRTPSLFVFDRTTGTTTTLSTGSGDGWTSWSSRPLVSDNGASVAFQSWDSGVVNGDFNRVQDIFATSQLDLILDSDNDGIPDWWTLKYFGHATGMASDLSRAQDDADGNGMSNLQKYLTGTDPTDPTAVFALQISLPTHSGGTVSLSWPAVPGKSYQLQYTDDLNKAAWQVYSGSVAVIGRQGSVKLQGPPTPRFYRVVCLN